MRLSISDQNKLTQISSVQGLDYLNKLFQIYFSVAVATQKA